ncbi:M20/M25/M40 family metallo-hydrolase [Marivirga sp. S37H4]|uniref:M20/M25/M40 family metallo-hydrolase n=1 Tax=Marivirga aurantiaca TaxID=2802615 RepID=A0A934X2T8_9BACT|nr:M20/M25/M40 family metallo-hydrolase [Marivirga aurantiaca]MBK6267422.1 M20/M25/M40 family metallo-hydrolase [Marivirga aurantiaca]
MLKNLFLKFILGVLLTTSHLISFAEQEPDSVSLWPKSISYNETISLLSGYIKRESVTGNEKEAAIYMEDYIRMSDLNLRVFSDDPDRYNLAASLYPLASGKPNIVFQSHIDVVPAENLDIWTHDPYSGHFDGEYIHGRGALDCKGLGVMQLKALMAFKADYDTMDLPFNVTVLFVSGEETGGYNGSEYVLSNFKKELNAAVVMGEGGAGYKNVLRNKPNKIVFGVSVAEKQSLWVKLKVVNEDAGHGAAPSSNYANLQLINSLNNLNTRKTNLLFNRSTRQMFRRLGRAEGGIRGFFIRNINWSILAPFVRKQVENDPFFSSLITNTITVSNIFNPPGPPNQISNYAVAILDCRLVPGTSSKSFLRYIERKLDNDNIEVSVISKSPEAKPSKLNQYYKAIERSIEEVYPDSETIPFLFPATSDNSAFRSHDIPSYGLIPAVINSRDINSIHSHNEKISMEALGSGIRIYYNFLKEVQLKEPFSLRGYIFKDIDEEE